MILVTTGKDDGVDRFRLVDVVQRVERLLRECTEGSKFSLGGLATVGRGQGFFVAVNGASWLGEGGGSGGGGGKWDGDGNGMAVG